MRKDIYADVVEKLKKDQRLRDVQRGLVLNNYIRTVNYHSTNFINKMSFEKEIARFSRDYSPVSLHDLDIFLETGKWHKEKPGLILAIFEGFRNNYDVIWPIIEKYGMTGWFHIPAFFIDHPVDDQLDWAEAHELHITDPEEYSDGRYAMNREEVQKIARNHVISCHSGSHFQIFPDTSDADMKREIIDSKICLESMIDKNVEVFCWLYGEEYSWNKRAADYIKQAGYRYVLSNLKIERI